MQGYTRAGILCGILLICMVVVAIIAGPIFGILIGVCWLIFSGCYFYVEYLHQQDPLAKLKESARPGSFVEPIRILTTNYMAIYDWGEHSLEYDETSSIRKAYDLLSTQMNNIMESAIKYIKTYDYHTRPFPKYLQDLCEKSNKLVSRLHELQELILKIDDSTSEVDITYVDDMLSSLREMQD